MKLSIAQQRDLTKSAEIFLNLWEKFKTDISVAPTLHSLAYFTKKIVIYEGMNVHDPSILEYIINTAKEIENATTPEDISLSKLQGLNFSLFNQG